MIAYLQGKDVTVDVPDDIGDKELGDFAKNFSTHVDDQPDQAPALPNGNNPAKTAPKDPIVPERENGGWTPNFFESYIKPTMNKLPGLGLVDELAKIPAVQETEQKATDLAGAALRNVPDELGPLALPNELTETPETRAAAGQAIDAFTLGATKPILDPMLDQDYKDHPVWATAGHLTGDLGSLLATGSLLKVAGLGVKAAQAGAESAEVLASAPRFLPRAIMTGATFGTKTFFEKTIKAFQDGNVDPGEFGKAVLLQSVGGAAFGAIGGVAKMPVAVASAAGVMFTMSKMEGGTNAEAGLSAGVAAAFEMVGSMGRSEELNREAIQTVADSISNYAQKMDPKMAPEMADAIGGAIVEREAAKMGGLEAVVKGDAGKENTLQIIEDLNQRIRQGKIPSEMQDATARPQIETDAPVGETKPASPVTPPASPEPTEEGAAPAPDTVSPNQTLPPSNAKSLPAPLESGPARGQSLHTVFEPTPLSSQPSIADHPDFIQMTNDANAVVQHYADARGEPANSDFARKLWGEMHNAMGEIMTAEPADRMRVRDEVVAKYPDIEREFLTLRDKLWSDHTDGFFGFSVAGKYGHLRPKLGIEAEDNVLRGTSFPSETPSEKAPETTPETSAKKLKFDDQGLPVRKPGSVVSKIELPDGQVAKITHQMVLDEAEGLLSDAHDRRGTAGALEKFVLDNGKLRSFKADGDGNVPEAEEMSDVPVRFKGGKHAPDEMAQMAYDRGLLPEPSADLLRTELKAIHVRGKSPKLADFYDEAQRNLEQLFGGKKENLPDWLTQDQGGTDEVAAEKRASYGPARPYENAPDSLMGFRKHGMQKGFDETNYKHVQWVKIKFPDGTEHIDAIKGLNQPHALERARRNWDGAEIEAITAEQAKALDEPGFSAAEKRVQYGNPLSETELAHGTTSTNAKKIMKSGLEPKIGPFIKEMYGREYDNDFSGQTPAAFLAGRDDLRRSINAARFAVGKKLGKPFQDVTIEDLRKHGAVVVVEPEEPLRVGEDSEVTNKAGEVMEEPAPLGGEHGDYFVTENTPAKRIIQGDELASLAQGVEKGLSARQPAYHGSPYKFDKFTLNKIGTGEGNQSYGWGLYFAGNKAVADYYRQGLSTYAKPELFYDGKPHREIKNPSILSALDLIERFDTRETAINVIQGKIAEPALRNDDETDESLKSQLRSLKNIEAEKLIRKKGHLYQVDIPDDKYFIHYEAIIADQPKLASLSKALKLNIDPYEHTGENFYEALVQEFSHAVRNQKPTLANFSEQFSSASPEELASRFLASKGIAGIKYLDQGSRGSGAGGSSNYVLFDDSKVKVLSVQEPTASPYQQEFDFQKPAEPAGTKAEHTVAGGFRAIMKPHLEVEFKKNGAVMIPNRKIESPADLAYAFKFLHNEAQENFFLGAVKDGKIVAVEHLGFGTIDQVAVYPYETLNLIGKNSADGFFIVHNHPSGFVNPSEEDKSLTRRLDETLGKSGAKFMGHVIIDDTKFGFISPDYQVSEQEHQEYAKTKELPVLKKHFQWLRSKDTVKNGPAVTGPREAFELFKGIQKGTDEGMVYLLNTQNHILNAVVIPHGQFQAGTLQNLAAAYRANGMITVNSNLSEGKYRLLQIALGQTDIRLHDDISVKGDGYDSKLERFGETRAKFQGDGGAMAAEPGAGYGPDQPENPADRYNRLKDEAKARGMKPREAAAFAKSEILKNTAEPTSFPEVKPEGIPTLNDAVENIKEMGDEIRNLVTPAASNPIAGEILRENLGKMARSYDKAETALKTALDMFDRMSAKQNTDFIDKMEHGEEQSTPELETIASALRKLFDTKRTQVQDLGTGKLESFIENYFPHIWDQSEGVVSKATQKAAKKPFEGSKSFLKKRTIEFFKDGIKLGLTPVSYNPVELTLLKIREMDKYIAAHQTLNALKEEGLAKFIRVGGEVPEGWTKVDDKISTVMFKTDQGLVISGHYYTQSDAARLINNYLKPGLNKFALFRAYRYAGNLLNQFQLGFSAFHLGFTSMDSIVSKVALAVNQLALGHPIEAIKDALHAPIAPIENMLRGDKVIKAWMGKGTSSAFDEVMASAMESAGGRARMDQFYATNAWNQMVKYFRMGAPVRGLMRLPLALTEVSSKPILEYIVPRQKLGIFADIMRMEMEHNPNLSHDEMRTLAQRAWDSVDNRMGQLVYDNLFWNKTFKDLLMGSVRSVGWNLGTIRELAGGGLDLLKAPGKKLSGDDHFMSYRAAYFFALPIVVGISGAIYQYLRTGKGPENLKDYFYPKNGGLDNSGAAGRVALPSYMKDVYHYSQAPVQTVLNKLNPVLSLVQQTYANKDFYGVKMRNEDDPIVRQLMSEAAAYLRFAEPFGLRNMQKNVQSGNKSLADIVEPWIGITPAPYDINQSEAEKLAHHIGAEKVAIGGRTQAQADHTQLMRDLARKFQAKLPEAQTEMMAAFQSGKISTNDLTNLIRESRMTPIQRLTHNFSAEELQRVFNVATPEEKAQLETTLRMKDVRHRSKFVPQPTGQ